jgi:hypothetical protein
MKTVTLWHGTTESAAKTIAVGGFKSADTAALVRLTAVECGADPAGAAAALRDGHRLVLVQDGRDDAVWFATDRVRAARWAQRAPEAKWEALWGVWWHSHGGYDALPAPWDDPAAAAWHAERFFTDPPAVLKVTVQLSRIQDRYQSPLPAARAAIFASRAAEVSVAYPVPAEWVVDYEVVPRQIDFVAAAGLLGLTITELTRRVDAGEIIKCKPPTAPLDSWYWELDDLLPFFAYNPVAAVNEPSIPTEGLAERELSLRFHQHVLADVQYLRSRGYNPARFLGMIAQSGTAVTVAKELFSGRRHTSYGFERLWEMGELGRSVEFVANLPWFRALFTEDELDEARSRLIMHDFPVDERLAAAANHPPDWTVEV